MAAIRRDARSTFSCRWHIKLIVSYLLMFFVTLIRAGHHGHSQGGLDKLLAAGLIAKALAKGGEEGGGGGGHHYMPIPIPLHAGGGGGGGHHHHVHHKYVPIPVKHHTNFIIAHHRVPVPVHVPVPVVKTKLVHVPVERTKIVPIIVHKGKNTHPHSHSSQYPYNSPSSSTIHIKKGRIQHGPSASPSSGIAALATSPRDTRHLRITTLGMVRKVKDNSRNGTTAAIQFHRPSSRAPDKWIVVVKDKKRQPIRRLASDIITADSKIITRTAIANSTAVSPAGPR